VAWANSLAPGLRPQFVVVLAAIALLTQVSACSTTPTAHKASPTPVTPRDGGGDGVVRQTDQAVTPGCDCAEPTAATRPASPHVLHVSADPNNLPFTNDRLEGFENQIAKVIADELGVTIEYDWRAQRRGFFRNALKEGEAELVLGVPKGHDMALTTAAYYRSTYAFVYRKDRGIQVRSFDDPILRDLKIGVQLVGNDGVNTPPAHALARRGIIRNVVGYTLYGDYREETPPARIIDAVVNREVDVAIVWGPLAGYYAKMRHAPVGVVPVSPDLDAPGLPMAFNIAMGVRKGDTALKERVDAALVHRRADIRRILDEYGIPWLEPKAPPQKADKPDGPQGAQSNTGGPRS
jgi:quinoprotein dehydrogenase-associated probable ABC transporter substrate-binding protein